MQLEQFDQKYNTRMKEWRERFLAGEDVSNKVRPIIYESWLRCRYWNVDPEKVDHSPLSIEEFQLIEQEESELCEVTDPIIGRIFDQTKHLECLYSFANARGIMLRTWHGTFTSDIRAGAYVREKNVGTAGIPTCVYTGKNVTVYGYEHFCIPHRNIVCTASPIIDSRGNQIGALSMSCSLDAYHPYCSVIIQEAAKNVSEQIRLRFLLSMDHTLIESFGEGVLLLNTKGQVLRANSKAMDLLQCDPVQVSSSMDSLFFPFESRKNIAMGRAFSNEEVKLRQEENNARHLYFILNFTPTQHGGVLTFRPVKEMHAYAARVQGTANYHFSDILGVSPQIQ
ncbi:MAG: hypothetical protein ACI4P0_02000, partial [Mailhella sp.]